jgi:lysophospholipase L1-like esterase
MARTHGNMGRVLETTTPQVQTSQYADEWWIKRHQAKLTEVASRRGSIKLVLVGDSITQGWEDREVSANLWWQYFEPRNTLNLGFSGDRTEQVIWRLQNGEVSSIDPKLTVLLIGTNNTGHRQDAATDTALGIKAIIGELRTRLPDMTILLLAVFPRGESPSDPLRLINTEINQLIADYADNRIVHFLDIGHMFIHANGEIRTELIPDLLHLNEEGYRVWAEAMAPHLDRLLELP